MNHPDSWLLWSGRPCARQNRCGPPTEFPLPSSSNSGIIHHLSGTYLWKCSLLLVTCHGHGGSEVQLPGNTQHWLHVALTLSVISVSEMSCLSQTSLTKFPYLLTPHQVSLLTYSLTHSICVLHFCETVRGPVHGV